FGTHYVYQGNFAGFQIWDIADPAKPVLASVVECISSQGDPLVFGSLLFLSAEGAGNRNDCGTGGVQDPKDHMAGERIFDVSNPHAPKLVKNEQTCKGSHTYTLVPSPTDKNIVYLYVSGQQAARPATELAGCKNGTDPADATNSLYQLDIIKVPLDHPEQAKVIPGARIFTGLDPSPACMTFCAPVTAGGGGGRGGRGGRGGADSALAAAALRTGPRNCHDVTSYPEMHLLLAACTNYGILVDISNPEKPFRLAALADTNNFQGRHTAGFSNDGKKLIVTNEWGGGTSPMCQASSMLEMGGNTILTVSADKKKMTQHAYFKMPAAQSAQENCVAHNGGLIPVPGRDLYVQGWYQGGVDVMDFTDADHPKEIAYFDRGSIDPFPGADVPLPEPPPGAAPGARSRGTIGGSWGAYYWNGMVYSSELDRGLDVYELQPSAQLSANELAAAKLVTFQQYKPTTQPKLVWPPAFVVVRSYLDQLVRGNGLSSDRLTAISTALDAAEQKTGAARGAALTALAKQVDDDASGAKDAARVRMMSAAIKDLAAVSK
ncbi:MAG: LVIVD repeat-containing protein, partial [Gemmatimonadales bacterium]